jgi:hypothetical protein
MGRMVPGRKSTGRNRVIGRDLTMPVVDVMYENVEGWHRFTSPQIPGFCVIVEPDQFQTGLDDVPEAITNIIAGDHGRRVTATRLETYSDYSREKPPPIYHYMINS